MLQHDSEWQLTIIITADEFSINCFGCRRHHHVAQEILREHLPSPRTLCFECCNKILSGTYQELSLPRKF